MKVQEKCACGAMVQVETNDADQRFSFSTSSREGAVAFVKDWRRGHKKCLERVEWRPTLAVPPSKPSVVALPERPDAS